MDAQPLFMICCMPMIYTALVYFFGFYFGRNGLPIEIRRRNEKNNNDF